MPMVSTVRVEAAAARRLAPEGNPSSLVRGGGSEGERVGEGGRADGADPGAALTRRDPWNMRVHWGRSGSGSEVRSSYCPRRMEGSSVDCWVMVHLMREG